MFFTLTLLSFLILTPFSSFTNETAPPPLRSVVSNMRIALKSLVPKSYTSVNLGLDDQDKAVIENIGITQQICYNRYGNVALMKHELPDFINQLGNGDEQIIKAATEVIYRIVCNVIEASEKQTAWVTIRSFIPTHSRYIPRWHMDGYYYAPRYGPQYKFACTLKGNHTLFFPLDDEGRKIYQINRNNNKFLSQCFDITHADSVEGGYGAFFIVSDERFAALHSEPPVDSPRLFISVVPGHQCEIEELYDSRYP